MAYKVSKGKNKIRGEQTFVDVVSGSVISASYFVGNGSLLTGLTVASASYAQTASFAISSSFAVNSTTASILTGFNQNDYVLTSSFNNFTSSYNTGSFTGSFVGTASYAISASYSSNAATASYVLNVVSSSFATNAATASLLSGFTKSDYLTTSSFDSFTASYNTGSFTGSFTGSLLGTASFALNATTASYYNTSSLLITASVSNATVTFTKGNGSTFPITINNVANAETASLLIGFNKNDYVTTSSFNNFTASYNTGSFRGSFIGTASYAVTASYALNAQTASYYNTSSLLTTASVSNATITFTKGNGSTFPITINNVTNAQTASYVLNAVSSSYASNADLLDGKDSTSFAGLTSNTFIGNQTITGNVDITGIITANELRITYTTSSVIYTSGSTKFGDSSDDTHQFTGSVLAGVVSGTNATFNTFTGSLFGTASYTSLAATASYYDTSSLLITSSVSNATITFTKGDNSTFPLIINNVINAQTASYILNAVSSSYASNSDLLDGRDSTTFAGLTSNTFNGNQVISGNMQVTGIISGATAQFTTLTASNTLVANITTIANYAQFLPIDITIPPNKNASYIYTSGSTNDLYFTQYSGSTENTTRLRWIEGTLGTGLQHGGILSTVNGTTTFNVSAGSGIITTQNASITADPYPTVKQITWSNVVSQSLLYSGSTQITYVSMDNTGQVQQATTPPTLAQYKDRIILGRVLHQSGSVTNGTINSPALSYAQTANIFDFIRSFGPLKISGHVLAASGSTLGITKTAGASYAEGRNYSSDPEQPNIILASADPAITITKIFREYVSGSTTITLTNGNVGYTQIDPSLYNNNGTLASVGNNEWTNQRVYWFPKSVNKALFVYYGSQKFGTELEAVAGLLTENFTEGENTVGAAIYVGSITLKGNETNLSSTNVSISQGALFRAVGGGGGGGGGGSTPPAGLTTEVQFNDSGAFAGDLNFTFDKITHILSVPNISSTQITSSITGSTALFTVITGSIITGSTSLFTSGTTSTSIIGTALYASNRITTVVGDNIIYNIATASYDGMFVDYTARSGSNARAGQIMAIWSNSSAKYTETTTNDFGSTTGLAMAVVINGTNMQLSASASTADWTVKTIIRTI